MVPGFFPQPVDTVATVRCRAMQYKLFSQHKLVPLVCSLPDAYKACDKQTRKRKGGNKLWVGTSEYEVNIGLFVCLSFFLLQNPDYMKDGFQITITTMHVENDKGQQENVSCFIDQVSYSHTEISNEKLLLNPLLWPQVHNLPSDKLSKREVIHVDIVNDTVASSVSLALWQWKVSAAGVYSLRKGKVKCPYLSYGL